MSDQKPLLNAEPAEMLEHLKVLRLEPGDVLVVTYPCVLTMATVDRIREHFADLFPGYRAVVLEQGGNLGVVREGEAP